MKKKYIKISIELLSFNCFDVMNISVGDNMFEDNNDNYAPVDV